MRPLKMILLQTWPGYYNVKHELDEIAARKTRGAISRSRARWYELGEKCNKYFFNLEKRSYEKRHISKLKISEGITAEDSKV